MHGRAIVSKDRLVSGKHAQAPGDDGCQRLVYPHIMSDQRTNGNDVVVRGLVSAICNNSGLAFLLTMIQHLMI